MQIDTACGYFIKVTRDIIIIIIIIITRIKVNHCKNIAKYVSTLDLTEECTGDVDKTYCGIAHEMDTQTKQAKYMREWTMCRSTRPAGTSLKLPVT